jgi:hypothetical protein
MGDGHESGLQTGRVDMHALRSSNSRHSGSVRRSKLVALLSRQL